MNNLIVVEQLPVIKERLASKSAEIEAKVKEAKAMICTEDTVKTVKGIRANLNKDFAELEEQRKAVRASVMKPYEEFEKCYIELISSKYASADSDLKAKISDVETGLKNEKETEARGYFTEYAASLHIDWITYARAGINVTLTASMKSLKTQAKTFLDKIFDGILLIETQEFADEIMIEFKKSLNVSEAIRIVLDRKLAIAKEAERKAAIEAVRVQETIATEKVDAFLPPPAIAAPVKADPLYTTVFKVTATREKLIALREFLKDGGYKYE